MKKLIMIIVALIAITTLKAQDGIGVLTIDAKNINKLICGIVCDKINKVPGNMITVVIKPIFENIGPSRAKAHWKQIASPGFLIRDSILYIDNIPMSKYISSNQDFKFEYTINVPHHVGFIGRLRQKSKK